jgi:integral membrane protein, TerC family
MLDSTTMWIVFGVIVIIMFALDLGVFNRGSRHISVKKSLYLTAFWISIALVFSVFIYFQMGTDATMEYLTAYVIEKMMSIDNLFVFIIIFAYFQIPDEYQHKALFYGIIGALAFRALFIVVGVGLLDKFDFVLYIFGLILIITAIKTVMQKENPDKENFAMRLSKRFRSSPDLDGDKMFTMKDGVKMATPLFLCVIVIELTDIMFAFDSIPAVLGISTNTFIVYTSNIFAILGLRSLYFALKGTMGSLEYLKYGLGAILAFVGIKMFLSDIYHVDVLISLAFICTVLLVTVLASMIVKKRKARVSGV